MSVVLFCKFVYSLAGQLYNHYYECSPILSKYLDNTRKMYPTTADLTVPKSPIRSRSPRGSIVSRDHALGGATSSSSFSYTSRQQQEIVTAFTESMQEALQNARLLGLPYSDSSSGRQKEFLSEFMRRYEHRVLQETRQRATEWATSTAAGGSSSASRIALPRKSQQELLQEESLALAEQEQRFQEEEAEADAEIRRLCQELAVAVRSAASAASSGGSAVGGGGASSMTSNSRAVGAADTKKSASLEKTLQSINDLASKDLEFLGETLDIRTAPVDVSVTGINDT
ncbi:unnamed protein product [Amoebophrya sp. A25]|nr:unnamed protein product [Amoebophrya sp. A25]|eukprot:GSA25T00007376001.1